MVSLNQVSVYFGAFCLFKDVSFLINKKDRIGLVGKNGAGKTSLLRIITGNLGYDSGNVAMPGEITIGYLPQQMDVSNTKSVFDEAMSAFAEHQEIERRIKIVNEHLVDREDYESKEYIDLIHELSELQERFNILDGETIHANVELTLIGLGFERSNFNKPTSELSGGWRMRIELAKILLKKPELLLLDEPTNHLDIESIQWLENFLKDYSGAVLLISHDRAFLDNVTSRTLEISLGKIFDYRVPYTRYETLRQERLEQQSAAYKNQQKKITETEDFIERFRYKATKAVQVQSRIKQLEKIERIEIDEIDNSSMKFRFPPAPHSGNIVLEIENLSKSYGHHNVLNKISLIVNKNEKIALVGRNGEGKTTLSKIIVNELDHTGILKYGHKVSIGYYAQNQDELLDGNKTVFEIIDEAAKGEMRTKTRGLLGSFLFSGDTIDKKVKVLSGGERSRLALAKMLLEPVNLLVLDEPTNHLDLASKDILKQALQNYDGTLIIVSHDRYFLDGLVSKVIEFRNKKITEHIGGIYEFLEKKRISSLVELEKKNLVKSNSKTKVDNKLDYEKKKAFDREIKKVERKVMQTEFEISKLEKEIEIMDKMLANPENIEDDSLFTEYGKLKTELEKHLVIWEEQHEELEIKIEEKKNSEI